ncbi:hypothetical protein [Microtetraspora malaysiensis]|uniref:Uncharacterized protein n=1 Tax=Microtetraspora malaysiensis TaxID=161358 RepID=A0ABW6SKH7_9ACTN
MGTSGARTTTVIPPRGEAYGGGVDFSSKPATDTAWYNVPGLALTLPEAGVYTVTTEVTAQVAAPPNTQISIAQRLLVSGAVVPDSVRAVLFHGNAGTGGPSTWSVATAARTARHFVTAAGGDVVQVQVQRTSGGAHAGMPFTGIQNNGNRIEFVRAG